MGIETTPLFRYWKRYVVGRAVGGDNFVENYGIMARLLHHNGQLNIEPTIYDHIPLTAFSFTTRRMLSNMLNKKRFFRSDSGNEKDWRGLSVLCEQQNYVDVKMTDDPTQQVLYWWCKNNPKTATVAYLKVYLNVIDRSDVYEDIYESIEEDIRAYKMKLREKNFNPKIPIKHIDSTSSCDCNENVKVLRTDPNILTKSDVDRAQNGLPPQLYDAFVLYAKADFNYANEMLRKLEEENNLKLCLKDRDLLAGVSFAHVALTQLIEERCQHLIVILTKHFIQSPENEFLVHYAQACQIEHKTRKILPVVYEDDIVIPRTLKIYTQLYYSSTEGILIDFWTKLTYSIRQTNVLGEASPTVCTELPNSKYQLPVQSPFEQQSLTNTSAKETKENNGLGVDESGNSRQRFLISKLKLSHLKAEQKKTKTRKNLINCLRKLSNGVKL